MFKKTLLAAALATSAFGANAAITISSTSQDVSSQGLPLTKAQTLTSVVVKLAAADVSAFTNGAKLQLKFDGAFVSSAPSAPAYADPAVLATAFGTGGGVVLPGFAAPTITSSTVTTALNTTPTLGTGGANIAASLSAAIAGDTITFSNIPLLLASADVGSKVNITATLLTSTDVSVTSTASAPTEVAEVKNQFAAKVKTKADAKIDVANSRLTFESKAKTDTIVLDTDTVGTGATATTAKVTVKGDFSDDITKANDGTNDYAMNTAKTEATYTYTASTSPTVAAFLNQDTTLTFTVDGVDEIAPRSFTTSVDLGYTDAESSARTQALATDSSAGSWTLNGDSAYISFLPFGDKYSQSVTVTNTGTVSGEMSVDWTSNGVNPHLRHKN